ncbi:MAG: Aureobasidin resistance protein Aur1 [Alectoria fallacina]|uniref:Aureobasidin resistance protein Aur1 n=1 Tax=Alectoria fallacina TaxID=1903189 RepID=A0A8H3FH23_9LECA|nr:MAG: Aureobasidin resistance protein Aur1 [Alectoria fallacina]
MRKSAFLSRNDFQKTYANFHLPFSWLPSIPTIIPHRMRRRLRSKVRSRQSPSTSVGRLHTSYSPADTVESLHLHRWSFYDGQYIILIILAIFSLCIIPWPGPLVKTALATLIITALILPVTRQFLLPSLAIWSWLVFFYACGFIPSTWRPPIWVRVLPALENIFYGANLSNILSAHTSTFLSIMAWLPYGIIHFGAPVVCSTIMFIFAAPGTVPMFAKSFGWMNLIGVAIQLTFPCSPPWYENMYGLAPANYSIHGSPAGLAAIDKLFGIALYTPGFTGSPMVFGAFPSLHAGSAVMEALFMSHVFPRLTPLFALYTLWLWWATMYLSHHYAVDLVGGSLLSGVIFHVVKSKFLPRQQPNKFLRWDYDFVEVGDDPAEKGYVTLDSGTEETDDWTVGSSSSVSSDLRSPIDESDSWEGATLASHSDTEAQR